MKIIEDLSKPIKLSIKKYASDPSVKQARNVTVTLWDWGDKTYKSVSDDFNDNGFTKDCDKSCDFCCFQNVSINVFEAIVISDWIRDILNINKKLYENAKLININSIDDTNDSERWKRREPCACLDKENKTCIIYPVRPLECRLAISHDKKACQSSFNNKTTQSISVCPPSGVGIKLPKETVYQDEINDIADYVHISLVDAISTYLMGIICSKREIQGKYIYPRTMKQKIFLSNMELNRTLKFTLKGETNIKIKSLVRLKPNATSECAKITIPMM